MHLQTPHRVFWRDLKPAHVGSHVSVLNSERECPVVRGYALCDIWWLLLELMLAPCKYDGRVVLMGLFLPLNTPVAHSNLGAVSHY